MEIFPNTNFQFLGGKKKWYLLTSSLLVLMSLIAMVGHYRQTGSLVPLGVDFRGGTLVYVKFTERPNEENIRQAMQRTGLPSARIQRFGAAADNEVVIALEQRETTEAALDQGKNAIVRALQPNVPEGKLDLNNTGTQSIKDYLLERDPLRAGTDAEQRYQNIAQAITNFRDVQRRGVIASFDELKSVVDPAIFTTLGERFYVSNFAVRRVEIVGPQVGEQLRTQAILAVVYASIGMLVYLWFRFELIFGVASVVAVVHDTFITLGIFTLLREEISLTVIAALLTLVGYSMNDTIVIFDRIRENRRLMRREPLEEIANRSINQTLGRTILTSGLTFLTVLALLLWGGEVLHGFSLALVIGILIGTYSTIGVASPLVIWYHNRRTRMRGGVAAVAETRGREKVRA